VLEAWDGSLFADAVSSTTLEPGQVIFARWLTLMLSNTFGDELGIGTQFDQFNAARALVNALIHVLDDALGTGSGVPPSRDYFKRHRPQRNLPNLDQALGPLGPDPWPGTLHPAHRVGAKPR
jgi:hypothetical protein